MKKISLLAASVAVALAGCGSDSGSSTGGSAGATITAFDGYFKNAVVFVDKNNDGVWDLTSDTFVGLTDANGQVDLGSITISDGESLAVQTVTPTGTAINNLLAIDPELYAGTYTVDMDAPGQSMEHELVFRAPHTSDVISPITDLVALEYKATGDLDAAEQTIETILGDGEEVDLYSDFVEGSEADAAMHKTAQIITESKAEAESSGTTYDATVAKNVAQEADDAVDAIPENSPLLEDDSFKPVVPVAGDGTVTPIPDSEITDPDYKTTVNSAVLKEIQDVVDSLNLKLGTGNGEIHHKIDITELFQDKNVSSDDLDTFVDSITYNGLDIKNEFNLEVYLSEPDSYDGQRFLFIALPEGQEITKAGEVAIELSIPENQTLKVSAVETEVEFEISAGSASAPEVTAVLDTIEDTVSQWELVEGEDVDTTNPIYTVSYAGLFDSDNELLITHKTNLHSNALELHMHNGNLELFGTPQHSSEDTGLDYKIWITAEDKETGLETTVTIDVPEIAEEPEPELHPLEGKTWYFLEHGESSDDESDTKEYSRIWCDSIHLEDGLVKYNQRSLDNNTECSEPTESVDQSSYVINSAGDVEITFTWDHDDNSSTPDVSEVHTVTLADLTGADLIPDTQTIVTSYDSVEDDPDQGVISERYVYFSEKADAEARLNIQSEDGPEIGERAFEFNYPHLETGTDLTWNQGVVTIALSNESDGDSNEDDTYSDADIYFDDPNQNIDCAYLNEFFTSFAITGEAINEPNKGGNSSHIIYSSGGQFGFECYTSTDQDSAVSHATIDFDIPHKLEENAMYNLIGYARTSENSDGELRNNGEFIESVKFNIEWTGTANND